MVVASIPGRTSGPWHRRKTFRKKSYRSTNFFLLLLKGQEMIISCLFGIPIFVTDPWHSPVDVWRPYIPQLMQQRTPRSLIAYVTCNARLRKMSRTVERREKNAGLHSFPVHFEQSRTLPAIGKLSLIHI